MVEVLDTSDLRRRAMGHGTAREASESADITSALPPPVATRAAVPVQTLHADEPTQKLLLEKDFQILKQAEADLQKRQEKAAVDAAAAAAKEAAAKEREESARPYSDAGLLMLVEFRLKQQHRFDNSSQGGVRAIDRCKG